MAEPPECFAELKKRLGCEGCGRLPGLSGTGPGRQKSARPRWQHGGPPGDGGGRPRGGSAAAPHSLWRSLRSSLAHLNRSRTASRPPFRPCSRRAMSAIIADSIAFFCCRRFWSVLSRSRVFPHASACHRPSDSSTWSFWGGTAAASARRRFARRRGVPPALLPAQPRLHDLPGCPQSAAGCAPSVAPRTPPSARDRGCRARRPPPAKESPSAKARASASPRACACP
jgi:hypothetical protein